MTPMPSNESPQIKLCECIRTVINVGEQTCAKCGGYAWFKKVEDANSPNPEIAARIFKNVLIYEPPFLELGLKVLTALDEKDRLWGEKLDVEKRLHMACVPIQQKMLERISELESKLKALETIDMDWHLEIDKRRESEEKVKALEEENKRLKEGNQEEIEMITEELSKSRVEKIHENFELKSLCEKMAELLKEFYDEYDKATESEFNVGISETPIARKYEDVLDEWKKFKDGGESR